MEVIIAGCGRVGSVLAYRLNQKETKVTVIDQNSLRFDNLPPDFNGRVVEGDVLDLKVLQRAGIERADAFVAATDNDSVNAVSGHLAKSVFHISNVLVRNQEPRLKAVHDVFGLESVGPASWGIQRLEELLYSDPLRVVYSNGNTRGKIIRYVIPQGLHGTALQDLLSEERPQPFVILRDGRPVQPIPSFILASGDEIFIYASEKDIEAFRSRLDSVKEH